jgi:hypothetical protein
MKTFGTHKAMTFYFSIAVASGILLFACAQSRRKHPVEGAAGLDSGDVVEDASRDAGYGVQPGAGRDAGTTREQAAIEGGDEASQRGIAEEAGDRVETSEAGEPDGAPIGAKLDWQEAEALIPDFVYQKWPMLNPDIVFEIEIQVVAGLWEALNVQLFTVYFLGGPDDTARFRTETLIYRQGELDVLLSPTHSNFMSGTVVQGVFYYTYRFGSGILRSHVGKLLVEQGSLTLKESGGFSFQDLFVKATGDAVEVQTGIHESFNSWRDGEFFGTIKDNGDTLMLLDASGGEIEPDFPPYDAPRRLFDL